MGDRRQFSERVADSFDRSLFSLIETAKHNSIDSASFTIAQRTVWREVWFLLSDARPKVRSMMSKANREATS